MMPEPTDDFQLNQGSHFSMGDKGRVNDNSNYHHETLVLLSVFSSKLAYVVIYLSYTRKCWLIIFYQQHCTIQKSVPDSYCQMALHQDELDIFLMDQH